MPRPVPSALSSWLGALVCPNCRQGLEGAEGGLRCPSRHSFDVARAGYVSLLSGARATSGDDDDMARARDRFLSTGAYRPIREVIGELAAGDDAEATTDQGPEGTPGPWPGSILDIGGGTGYYLAGVLDRLPAASGLGVDTSARALRFAARSHQRAAAASWDVFARFPLRDESVDLVLDVFAPRNPPEFARVLRPDGRLLVVRPAADHLAQLREAVPGMISVDPRKEERLHETLDPLFTAGDVRHVQFTLDLDERTGTDLVAMTPSARHVGDGRLDQFLRAVPRVTISVIAGIHRRR